MNLFSMGGMIMPRKEGITDEMIIDMRNAGHHYKQISEFCGLSARAIRNIFYKHGIETREQYSGQPRKHKVNEHFFKQWSHEMAWVLGFFVADGCINKSFHSISFSQKDTAVLEVVADYMDADLNIHYRDDCTPLLLIHSKIIKQDLMKMGITPAKSSSITLPYVPQEYLNSFIRGLIDGDGWVDIEGYSMHITTGSKVFSRELEQIFHQWGLNADVRESLSDTGKPIYRTWIRGKNDIAKLSEIIYNSDLNHEIHLKKRARMSQWSMSMSEKVSKDFIDGSDENRVSLQVRIDKDILKDFSNLAKHYNSTISYLIENGIEHMLKNQIAHPKRPRTIQNRKILRMTIDKELYEELMYTINEKSIKRNDILEDSIHYIQFDSVKDKNWRYRTK